MDSMTPKERWLAVLTRQQPDRVPMDYWATDETTRKLMQHLGCASVEALYETLHLDAVLTVKPSYVGPPLPAAADFYGCRYRDVDYELGTYRECVYHPLAQYQTIAEIEANYTWPSADWFDYSVIRQQINRRAQYPIQGGGSEPFLTYTYLRGMEQAYFDLVSNPELVQHCLGRLFDFHYEDTRRIFEQAPGQIDLSYVAEDFGSQSSLLFSPQLIRQMFIPGMRRMIELAHEAGVYVFFHSDGAIFDIIPDMIAAGIDLLNPLQWRCKGMERERLKGAFGQQVVLHGGMDNQYTLAFGSPDEVRQEAIDNLEVLGKGGGYILAPCHNLQAVSPVENIITMYETGYEYGRL